MTHYLQGGANPWSVQDSKGKVICHLLSGDSDEVRDLARLLSAAPDLLAAVEACLHAFSETPAATEAQVWAHKQCILARSRARTLAHCAWCHALQEVFVSLEQSWCSKCGHRAGVPREQCNCPACPRPQAAAAT